MNRRTENQVRLNKWNKCCYLPAHPAPAACTSCSWTHKRRQENPKQLRGWSQTAACAKAVDNGDLHVGTVHNVHFQAVKIVAIKVLFKDFLSEVRTVTALLTLMHFSLGVFLFLSAWLNHYLYRCSTRKKTIIYIPLKHTQHPCDFSERKNDKR